MGRPACVKSTACLWLAIGFLLGLLPGLYLGLTNIYTPQTMALQRKVSQNPSSNNNTHIYSKDAEVARTLEITIGNDRPDTREPPLTHPNWCPFATCQNTDLCKPCQRRFLLLIATARSASTTLTWMLNELPGVRMSGENNNQLDAILQMKNNVLNHSAFHHGSGRKNAWGHNYIPNQNFACAAQSVMQAINPPQLVNRTILQDKESEQFDIIGFKTIRFERGDDQHVIDMVDMVKENLPCSRVLINISSNTTRQAESFRKANFYPVSARTLGIRNEKLKRVKDLFGEQALLLDSAKWTEDISSLNSVVDWLGFDDACRFNELLMFNTGNMGRGFHNNKTKLSYRDPNCKRI